MRNYLLITTNKKNLLMRKTSVTTRRSTPRTTDGFLSHPRMYPESYRWFLVTIMAFSVVKSKGDIMALNFIPEDLRLNTDTQNYILKRW